MHHDVGKELVTGKDAFDIAGTIAPCPKFFDDPSRQSNGRIIQSVTQGLRLGCLFMAVAPFSIPPRAELSEITTRNFILRPYVQRAPEQKTSRDVVQMNPNHGLSGIEPQRNRNRRPPSAAPPPERHHPEFLH